MPVLKQELLDILCCPKCRGALTYDQSASTLTCTSCSTLYPVKDGIPIMLVDEGNSA